MKQPAGGNGYKPLNIRIRLAGIDDIAAMHRVRIAAKENRLSLPHGIGEADYRPFVSADCAWVAEIDQSVVGFAAIDGAKRSIWALFVAPGVEGKGIGRILHDTMIEGARAQELGELWLSTEPGTRAEHFYGRLGWKPYGLDDNGEMRFRLTLPT